MRKPHISLAAVGSRLLAYGYGEWHEADWKKAGIIERGRLVDAAAAASVLRGVYRRLFHRRFLVYPRVLALLPVAAPAAEYLLWDGVLRHSGAWDWEIAGVESIFESPANSPNPLPGYRIVLHLAADFVAVSLLKGGQRAAASMLQAGSDDLAAAVNDVAAAEIRRLLTRYAAAVSADEAGTLAQLHLLVFTCRNEQETEVAVRERLEGIETGACTVQTAAAFEAAVRMALAAS